MPDCRRQLPIPAFPVPHVSPAPAAAAAATLAGAGAADAPADAASIASTAASVTRRGARAPAAAAAVTGRGASASAAAAAATIARTRYWGAHVAPNGGNGRPSGARDRAVPRPPVPVNFMHVLPPLLQILLQQLQSCDLTLHHVAAQVEIDSKI